MTRRIVASVVLVIHDHRTLVLRRPPRDRGFPHAWCLPGGQREPGEPLEACAIRETREETGLDVELVDALGRRETPVVGRPVVFDIHRFVAIAEAPRVLLSEEHVDHRWLSRSDARRASALPGGLAGENTAELLARFADGELPR